MKAILVVDIKGAEHIIEASYKPEGYVRFVLDKDNEHFCAYIPIDDAKLLPTPKRYVEDDFVIETTREAEACTHGVQIGRNMLINEILGETYEETDNH